MFWYGHPSAHFKLLHQTDTVTRNCQTFSDKAEGLKDTFEFIQYKPELTFCC